MLSVSTNKLFVVVVGAALFAGLFWSGLIPLGAGVPLAQGQELPDPVVITIEESIVLGDTPVAGDSDIGVTETLGVDESYAAEGQADTTPPEISVPANVVVQATNASGQVVTYSAATAFDNQDPNPSLSCAPASGSTFDLGSTTVQCSSADASGNTGSRSFTVVVQDTVPPVLTQIPDLKREVTDPKGGPMAFAVPTATDAVDTSVVVTCNPASGSNFPVARTRVLCSGRDDSGNTGFSVFFVTITLAPGAGSTSSSGDQQLIAYVSTMCGEEDILITDPTGKKLKRLTSSGRNERDPAWSPDGKKMAFTAGPLNGNSEIYTMNVDLSRGLLTSPSQRSLCKRQKLPGLKKVTNNTAQDYDPSWSPDGKWIVFTSKRDGNEEIYKIPSAGCPKSKRSRKSCATRLTKNKRIQDRQPDWSPDGKRIVFSSNKDKNFEIYVMPSSGCSSRSRNCPVRLTKQSGSDFSPSWSPNGSQIVYVGKARRGQEVRVMSAVDRNRDGNGDNMSRVALTTTSNPHPAWSPDGTRIVYVNQKGRNYDLYVVNKDGKNRTRVTRNGARDQSPDWLWPP